MHLFLYILFIILGYYSILGIFIPQEQRKVTWSIIKILPLKVWGLVNLFLGLFLFRTAEIFPFPVIFYLLSLLLFLEAALLLFAPKQKIKKIIHFWLLLPNSILKIISLIFLVLTIVLFLLFKTYS
ncbi:MAG: hypothetical protein PHN37_01130 [Candidatus Pacebacteria bacterium]|nr:hypothetical protein [Candidatus Paceibacterota bacterium]